jgi:pyruvate formate lyase activating enzyme
MRKAMLWEKISDSKVRCLLCRHACLIENGGFGSCGMRKCENGELLTFSYEKTVAEHLDPIEKKPLYHFLPGTTTYSIAGAGCNFTCSFCQNWQISTISALKGDALGHEASASELAEKAVRSGAKSVSYTYTEPTIFFEYAYEIAEKAAGKGLRNVFVTNGYMSADAVDKISPLLDAANIDLKFFDAGSYRKYCGAELDPVLETIAKMKSSGIWVEVTTLLIPGVNDSDAELERLTGFLANLDAEMPWHISRFHPDHKMPDKPLTPARTLAKARNIAEKAGLKHVYAAGNDGWADTICPGCGETLVERHGYITKATQRFLVEGKCPACDKPVPGIWL